MLTVHTPAKQKCSPVSCYFSYSAILMAQVSLSFFHFVLYDTKVGRMKA